MNHIVHAEIGLHRGGDFDAFHGSAKAVIATFGASIEAVLRNQDAPRVSSASSRRLAMTRLAKPNRLNSCASFFASPL